MQASLLDTDTLSEIIKGRDSLVYRRAQDYLAMFGVFSFSLITRYEILRGLKAKNATARIVVFDRQCQASHVLPLTDEVVVRAADLYADLRARGQLISDADLLIAATALVQDLVLITNNTQHFSHIPALDLDSWAKPRIS